ncbi:DJ-1/PfpI family protein [Alkalihalobacillus trypoxylicola]|uniref:Thiamine biosynthesis protein ThiJ n=1 Tax=Alkalihalobacillus trypoxylicola TaxID=519424 RepID=A0A162F3I4_9BACI|nr:DJ-1/PfpI family protein [Alkalihalobacillus trypoxylicola]KYG34414.1 thiamine biosynthesis protein ThiJ [Alkalihalobacillus trypoxylicola]
MNIQIVLFEGVDLLDAIAPYEVFSAASMYTSEKIIVEFVGSDKEEYVLSGINDYPLTVSNKLDLSKKGIVLIPGASGSIDENDPNSVPMKLRRASESGLREQITKAINNPEILVTSVCGGSLLMAMTGVLEGRHVVTHYMGMDLLSATGAIPINARVVDDGDIISGAGVTSGLDLALYVVERELGPRIAHEVEQFFQYEKRGTVWKNEGVEPILLSTTQEEDAFNQSETNVNLNQHDILGDWEVFISTPVGKMQFIYTFINKEGVLTGTATDRTDITNVSILEDIHVNNKNITWTQKVKKPMSLKLKFEVNKLENQLKGVAKAGLISSKFIGKRVQ